MGKILAKQVAVWDDAVGKRVKFYPGDELPEKFEDKVTNPQLFQEFYRGTGSDLDPTPEEEHWTKGMTIPKLKIIAEDEGVDLEGINKKKEIIEAIEAHRAANPDDEEFPSGNAD
jgi:hypothetical protein